MKFLPFNWQRFWQWRALATLINRLFSDLRCQISGGHSSTESSLENWLWFSTSPYSGLKSVSSLPFDSWLSSPQFSATWFSSKFCCAKLYCIPNGFLKLWQISSKWASFALNSVLGKGIYGSALQSLLSSTVSIFFEFLFLGILSDLHLTFWVFNIVNLRTSSDKQSLSSIVRKLDIIGKFTLIFFFFGQLSSTSGYVINFRPAQHLSLETKKKRSRALDDYESSSLFLCSSRHFSTKVMTFCVLETMVDMFEKKMSTPYPPAGQFNPGIIDWPKMT